MIRLDNCNLNLIHVLMPSKTPWIACFDDGPRLAVPEIEELPRMPRNCVPKTCEVNFKIAATRRDRRSGTTTWLGFFFSAAHCHAFAERKFGGEAVRALVKPERFPATSRIGTLVRPTSNTRRIRVKRSIDQAAATDEKQTKGAVPKTLEVRTLIRRSSYRCEFQRACGLENGYLKKAAAVAKREPHAPASSAKCGKPRG